jgi:hypothetical protein
MQWPFRHWAAPVHAVPFGFKPQELPAQVLGGAHCASAVQEALHAPATQAKVPQDLVAGVAQAPWPSQVETGVAKDAAGQLASLHLLPLVT